ncbi:MAG: hypothetical protein RLZZ502_325, partial [Pseudomonadota bacterium]
AESVVTACAEVSGQEVVEAVNFNDPVQTVIAGHRGAVERAIEHCKAKGAKRGLLLPVSAPFHSSLLAPAAQRLAEHLSGLAFAPAQIRLTHNADLSDAAGPDAVRAALAKQAASPVKWLQTVQKMASEGVTHIVECGPGKALSGMCKRIAPEISVLNMNTPDSITKTLEALQ